MSITTDITSASTGTQSGQAVAFMTDRATLVDALTTVGLAVSTTSARPSEGGVLLEGRDGHLVISATDRDTAVSVRVPDAARTVGRLLIDHAEITKLLGALVKGTRKRDADTLPVAIKAAEPSTPVVELAGYVVPLTTYPIGECPNLPAVPPVVAQVDRDTFTAKVTRVLRAVATDPGLPVFTGVKLDIGPGAVTLAGTDRYRLAVAPVPAVSGAMDVSDSGTLVSGGLLSKIVKRFCGEHVRIGLRPGEPLSAVSFTCGEVTVVTHPISDQFPAYARLLPADSAGTIVVDRAALLTQTQRASAVLAAKRERSGSVELRITPSSVSVAPVLSERADALTAPAVAAQVDGINEATAWWFAPGYLADALDSFIGDTITLHPKGRPGQPVLFTDAPNGLRDASTFRHLLMSRTPPK
ncbi:MAG TPA: DNA polymerase III subunit beta [Pseudonocardiaceae bacterium]|nr:DNA polymerase III subunit beta [Pseudonocardiaceae bacterium]